MQSRPVEALELLGRGRSLDPSSVACTAFYAVRPSPDACCMAAAKRAEWPLPFAGRAGVIWQKRRGADPARVLLQHLTDDGTRPSHLRSPSRVLSSLEGELTTLLRLCSTAVPYPSLSQVADLLPLGKAYVVLGEDVKGEQLLKSAWARGGDPYELGAAQVGRCASAGCGGARIVRWGLRPGSVWGERWCGGNGVESHAYLPTMTVPP